MKKALILSLFAVLVLSIAGLAQDGEWHDNFDKAKQEAKSSGKYILLNFSGSDWCGWCIKLSNEVFQEKAFKAYAEKNLVLAVADFPRKTQLSDEVTKQNQNLMEKYGIRGFPTILIISPSGELVAQTGYQRGGPEKYVSHIKELISKYKPVS